MTQTFADYVASRPEAEAQQQSVKNYTEMLCEALVQDYKSYAARGGFSNSEPPEYSIQEAKKYLKVWMRDGSHRSIHAFIDKKTGEVFKPASVKAPAKGARFNLLRDESRELCFERADWAGGYLYR